MTKIGRFMLGPLAPWTPGRRFGATPSKGECEVHRSQIYFTSDGKYLVLSFSM